ncbi:MAG: hypothetical protein CFE25_00125 [Chitinophagaceae bacterium BSSC1]|nr:MAG: hypothetical protein CFE25_00125 [Chitinophagaceae bacterium BSSC1]
MTPEEIKEILNQSGYLFEQQVASIIEGLGFHVTTNKAYLDEEEDKSREIDVYGYKVFFEIPGDVSSIGIVYINCECKKSSTPYVFINRKKGIQDQHYVPDGINLIYNKYYKRIGDNSLTEIEAFTYLNLQQKHFYTREPYKAVQICKIIQNGKKIEAQHSGVIEGFIYPLTKSMKVWKNQAHSNNTKQRFCKLFLNIAVVDSQLYTINVDDENPMPIESNYVPFIRGIQSKNIKGTYLFTFVKFDYLKNFIKNEIEGFCSEVSQKYINDPSLINDQYLY